MRIAVALDDGVQVAAHAGRCRGFVIFELVGQDATRVEYRLNEFTAHVRGECQSAHARHRSSGQHSHEPLMEAWADCRVLVTRGLGPRLVADLATRAIAAYVCSSDSVDEAAGLYARGQLPVVTGRICDCHGS